MRAPRNFRKRFAGRHLCHVTVAHRFFLGGEGGGSSSYDCVYYVDLPPQHHLFGAGEQTPPHTHTHIFNLGQRCLEADKPCGRHLRKSVLCPTTQSFESACAFMAPPAMMRLIISLRRSEFDSQNGLLSAPGQPRPRYRSASAANNFGGRSPKKDERDPNKCSTGGMNRPSSLHLLWLIAHGG